MGCGCGGSPSSGPAEYVVTFPNGTTKTVTTEIDAKVAAAKAGGTWRKTK